MPDRTGRSMGIDLIERYLCLLHLVMIRYSELRGIIPDDIRTLIQMDVKLLKTQGERQSALLDTLCRIVGKINIRRFADAKMHHSLLAVDMRDEGTCEDDDEGKMKRPGRNSFHLSLDDIENAQGG